jgi:hypothetical protein
VVEAVMVFSDRDLLDGFMAAIAAPPCEVRTVGDEEGFVEEVSRGTGYRIIVDPVPGGVTYTFLDEMGGLMPPGKDPP